MRRSGYAIAVAHVQRADGDLQRAALSVNRCDRRCRSCASAAPGGRGGPQGPAPAMGSCQSRTPRPSAAVVLTGFGLSPRQRATAGTGSSTGGTREWRRSARAGTSPALDQGRGRVRARVARSCTCSAPTEISNERHFRSIGVIEGAVRALPPRPGSGRPQGPAPVMGRYRSRTPRPNAAVVLIGFGSVRGRGQLPGPGPRPAARVSGGAPRGWALLPRWIRGRGCVRARVADARSRSGALGAPTGAGRAPSAGADHHLRDDWDERPAAAASASAARRTTVMDSSSITASSGPGALAPPGLGEAGAGPGSGATSMGAGGTTGSGAISGEAGPRRSSRAGDPEDGGGRPDHRVGAHPGRPGEGSVEAVDGVGGVPKRRSATRRPARGA